MTNSLAYTRSTSCHAGQHRSGTQARYNNYGFSQARSCHTTALSDCNQPHEAYNPGIHQMAPPSTSGKQAYYSFIDPGRMKG